MPIARRGDHVCDPPPFECWVPPGTPYPTGTIWFCDECGRWWRLTKRGWRKLRWWHWERE